MTTAMTMAPAANTGISSSSSNWPKANRDVENRPLSGYGGVVKSRIQRTCMCDLGAACHGMSAAFAVMKDPRGFFVAIARDDTELISLHCRYLRPKQKDYSVITPTREEREEYCYVAVHHYDPSMTWVCDSDDDLVKLSKDWEGEVVPDYNFDRAHLDLGKAMRSHLAKVQLAVQKKREFRKQRRQEMVELAIRTVESSKKRYSYTQPPPPAIPPASSWKIELKPTFETAVEGEMEMFLEDDQETSEEEKVDAFEGIEMVFQLEPPTAGYSRSLPGSNHPQPAVTDNVTAPLAPKPSSKSMHIVETVDSESVASGSDGPMPPPAQSPPPTPTPTYPPFVDTFANPFDTVAPNPFDAAAPLSSPLPASANPFEAVMSSCANPFGQTSESDAAAAAAALGVCDILPSISEDASLEVWEDEPEEPQQDEESPSTSEDRDLELDPSTGEMMGSIFRPPETNATKEIETAGEEGQGQQKEEDAQPATTAINPPFSDFGGQSEDGEAAAQSSDMDESQEPLEDFRSLLKSSNVVVEASDQSSGLDSTAHVDDMDLVDVSSTLNDDPSLDSKPKMIYVSQAESEKAARGELEVEPSICYHNNPRSIWIFYGCIMVMAAGNVRYAQVLKQQRISRISPPHATAISVDDPTSASPVAIEEVDLIEDDALNVESLDPETADDTITKPTTPKSSWFWGTSIGHSPKDAPMSSNDDSPGEASSSEDDTTLSVDVPTPASPPSRGSSEEVNSNVVPDVESLAKTTKPETSKFSWFRGSSPSHGPEDELKDAIDDSTGQVSPSEIESNVETKDEEDKESPNEPDSESHKRSWFWGSSPKSSEGDDSINDDALLDQPRGDNPVQDEKIENTPVPDEAIKEELGISKHALHEEVVEPTKKSLWFWSSPKEGSDIEKPDSEAIIPEVEDLSSKMESKSSWFRGGPLSSTSPGLEAEETPLAGASSLGDVGINTNTGSESGLLLNDKREQQVMPSSAEEDPLGEGVSQVTTNDSLPTEIVLSTPADVVAKRTRPASRSLSGFLIQFPVFFLLILPGYILRFPLWVLSCLLAKKEVPAIAHSKKKGVPAIVPIVMPQISKDNTVNDDGAKRLRPASTNLAGHLIKIPVFFLLILPGYILRVPLWVLSCLFVAHEVSMEAPDILSQTSPDDVVNETMKSLPQTVDSIAAAKQDPRQPWHQLESRIMDIEHASEADNFTERALDRVMQPKDVVEKPLHLDQISEDFRVQKEDKPTLRAFSGETQNYWWELLQWKTVEKMDPPNVIHPAESWLFWWRLLFWRGIKQTDNPDQVNPVSSGSVAETLQFWWRLLSWGAFESSGHSDAFHPAERSLFWRELLSWRGFKVNWHPDVSQSCPSASAAETSLFWWRLLRWGLENHSVPLDVLHPAESSFFWWRLFAWRGIKQADHPDDIHSVSSSASVGETSSFWWQLMYFRAVQQTDHAEVVHQISPSASVAEASWFWWGLLSWPPHKQSDVNTLSSGPADESLEGGESLEWQEDSGQTLSSVYSINEQNDSVDRTLPPIVASKAKSESPPSFKLIWGFGTAKQQPESKTVEVSSASELIGEDGEVNVTLMATDREIDGVDGNALSLTGTEDVLSGKDLALDNSGVEAEPWKTEKSKLGKWASMTAFFSFARDTNNLSDPSKEKAILETTDVLPDPQPLKSAHGNSKSEDIAEKETVFTDTDEDKAEAAVMKNDEVSDSTDEVNAPVLGKEPQSEGLPTTKGAKNQSFRSEGESMETGFDGLNDDNLVSSKAGGEEEMVNRTIAGDEGAHEAGTETQGGDPAETAQDMVSTIKEHMKVAIVKWYNSGFALESVMLVAGAYFYWGRR